MKYPRRRRRRALQQSLVYTRRREGRRRGKALHSSLPTKSFPPFTGLVGAVALRSRQRLTDSVQVSH
ncbi:unnamed protein product [Sphagnum troendelagicum]